MCLRPIHIKMKESFHKYGCSIPLPNHRGVLLSRFTSEKEELLYKNGLFVPCGKCIECLNTRSNDYAQFIARAAEQYSSFFFITLTYSDEAVPICKCSVSYDQDDNLTINKEVVTSFNPYQRISVFNDLFNEVHSVRPIVTGKLNKCNYPIHIDDENVWYTKSLCRRDVALWLKRCRVAWNRSHDDKCSDFKVFYIGEYGLQTSRPHYHMGIFGMSDDELKFFVADWKEHFGYVDLSNYKVDVGHEIYAGQYIAKYCSKGSFDFQYMSYVEKPFICISHNLVTLTEKEKSHYLGYDIPDDDPNKLDLLFQRRNNWNGTGMPVGKHISRLLYYDRRKNVIRRLRLKGRRTPAPCCGETVEIRFAKARAAFMAKLGLLPCLKMDLSFVPKIRVSYKATSLQDAFVSIIQAQFYNDYLRAKESYYDNPDSLSRNDFQAYYKDHLRWQTENRARSLWLKRQRFYAESVF